MDGLRRRCARRLRGIDVPDPFDLDLFCAGLAVSRGRPLHRRPLPSLASPRPVPGAPCGLWLGLPGADYVFFDPGTSPLHAEHIVLHEIAHILCGHTAGPTGSAALAQLFPDLDPALVSQALASRALVSRALVSRALGRAGHTTEQEREAEMLASMIRTTGAPAPDDPLGRIAGALGAIT